MTARMLGLALMFGSIGSIGFAGDDKPQNKDKTESVPVASYKEIFADGRQSFNIGRKHDLGILPVAAVTESSFSYQTVQTVLGVAYEKKNGEKVAVATVREEAARPVEVKFNEKGVRFSYPDGKAIPIEVLRKMKVGDIVVLSAARAADEPIPVGWKVLQPQTIILQFGCEDEKLPLKK